MVTIEREPLAYSIPEVRCGDCRHFVPDQINPPAGGGTCLADSPELYRNHRGTKQVVRPFTKIECEDYETEKETL